MSTKSTPKPNQSLPLRKPPLEVLEVDDHHVMGIAFNMGFALWIETELLTFRRLDNALTKLARSHPEGVGVCQIVERNAVPPSSQTRARITEMIRQGAAGNLKHYSVTFEGTGFKAAAVRAIVSASQMVARTTTHLAVFNSVVEAAKWHADEQQTLGRKETAHDIAAVIDELRGEFDRYITSANHRSPR